MLQIKSDLLETFIGNKKFLLFLGINIIFFLWIILGNYSTQQNFFDYFCLMYPGIPLFLNTFFKINIFRMMASEENVMLIVLTIYPAILSSLLLFLSMRDAAKKISTLTTDLLRLLSFVILALNIIMPLLFVFYGIGY
jgi:hypothetical protein